MTSTIPKSSYQFEGITLLGLHPDVKTLEEYKLRIERNIPKAHEELVVKNPLLDLTVQKILDTHQTIFSDIHPTWCGTLRNGEKSILKVGPYIAADHMRVPLELEAAIAQLNFLLSKSLPEPGTNRDLAPYAAIGFFHLRFERIHPVRDGNGRTGRVVMSTQAKQLTGHLMTFEDRDGYVNALRDGDKGRLTPMINYILKSTGAEGTSLEVPCPFRVAPYLIGDTNLPTTVEQLLIASRAFAVEKYKL